jgi:hypothetical protein
VSSDDEEQTFLIGPLEAISVTFVKSDDSNSEMTVHVQGALPVVLRLFVEWNGYSPAKGIPFQYEQIIWHNSTRDDHWEKTSLSEIHMMIRNDFAEPREYQLWSVELKDTYWKV